MTLASEQKVWTDEEFMALPEDGRYELVNGELVNMGNAIRAWSMARSAAFWEAVCRCMSDRKSSA